MTLPTPNLDDRTFRQILDEAIRLIPRYCPEWTNHNPSDPGIALLEVFAHLVEGMIWRMNRIPEKATVEYLRLLGHRLSPGLPARAPVTFTLAEGSGDRVVPAGTPLSAGDVPFETERDLVVGPARQVRCFSRAGGVSHDLDASMGRGKATPIFPEAAALHRFLYLGDPRLRDLRDGVGIALEDGRAGVLRDLDWEYRDGRGWRELPVRREGGEVLLQGPIRDIERGVVREVEDTWIRGRLRGEVPGEVARVHLRASGKDLIPDRLLVDGPGMMPEEIDATLPFFPFGREPALGVHLVLTCGVALSRRDTRVTLQLEVEGAEPSPDLVVLWEYPDGKGWSEIGRSTPQEPPPRSGHHFRDTTCAFTRSGEVTFLRPAEMAEPLVRARIHRGDFGTAPRPEGVGGSFRWACDRPLGPPRVTSFRIGFTQVPYPPCHALGQEDRRFRDLSSPLRDGVPIRPFVDPGDEAPSLYLGLDGPLPSGPAEIYFRVEEEVPAEGEAEIRWECYLESGWEPIPVMDRTTSFTRSGSVTFEGPPAQVRSEEFGETLHWLRARWLDGLPGVLPPLAGIHLHTTTAVQGTTIRGEVLGHADGTPHQEVRVASTPALAGITLAVGQREDPWREVPSLALSGPDDTDFECHPTSGTIRFGDGRRGRAPGSGPIRALSYRTGGGAVGNVGAGAISVIRRAVPGIGGVTNPYRAVGGVDPEGLDEAVPRALRSLRCRDRAVTAEDFEALALEASRTVARAWCTSVGTGEVVVVILPRPSPGRRPGDPIFTSRFLIEEVSRHLEERSLVTTRIRCRGPAYVGLEVDLTLVPAAEGAGAADLSARIEERIRVYLDPLLGGGHGQGWPPGRSVTRADIHAALSPVNEIDCLEEVRLSPGGSRVDLDPEVLPFLARASVHMERREP